MELGKLKKQIFFAKILRTHTSLCEVLKIVYPEHVDLWVAGKFRKAFKKVSERTLGEVVGKIFPNLGTQPLTHTHSQQTHNK